MPLSNSPRLPRLPAGQELAFLPGPRPGHALRICGDPASDGTVRLEQLAYSSSIGWYVQKSLTIPVELLGPLATQLRKAHCLCPEPPAGLAEGGPLSFPGPMGPA